MEVCVILPPDTDSRGLVQSEVFPRPPQCLDAGEGFGVEAPFDAPFFGAAPDVVDIGGQQPLVQDLGFNRLLSELRKRRFLRVT